MKLGAAREDRVYEELSNNDHVKQVLGDVSLLLLDIHRVIARHIFEQRRIVVCVLYCVS